jgi:hypothetical protein
MCFCFCTLGLLGSTLNACASVFAHWVFLDLGAVRWLLTNFFCLLLFLLLQSATHEKAVNATFVLKPLEGNLDWKLAAKAAPCYVTVRLFCELLLTTLAVGVSFL